MTKLSRRILPEGVDSQKVMTFAIMIFASIFHSQMISQEPEKSSSEQTLLLPELSIIGSEMAQQSLPASGVFLGEEDLKRSLHADIHRLLRQVPGVYVREEDGFGLFPNISIRGVSTDRSRAVTIMEDGILSAPAPYSASSAYYIPNIARMSGLEVLKGSSQIRYGPHITGGVINYLSTPIPTDALSHLKFSYGSFGEMLGHLWHGEVLQKDAGTIGYLIEGFFHQSDGFKTIAQTPDFTDGDDTGFMRIEPMVKVFWELPTQKYHRVEAKFGYSDLDANETYLGLAEADFHADPFQRYSASRFDNIQTENHRASFRHIMELSDRLRISSTAYLQHFNRNWRKLHQLRNFEISNLSQALLDENALDILRGNASGAFRVRNNAREYRMYGIQSVITLNFDLDKTSHLLETGMRYHFDEADRFQWDVDYDQAENGTIADSKIGAMGAAGDRVQQSRALAIYIQDAIRWKQWTLTPGFRFESVDQNYHQDQRREDQKSIPQKGEGRIDAYAGGVSLAYELRPNWNAFFGAHRGFSIPSPRASIRNSLNEESSLGFELGSRFADPNRGWMAEAIVFQTDLSDLIVGGNIGGGGSANTENVGNIRSRGLELTIGYDYGQSAGWAWRTPFELGLTLTDARLKGDARNTDPQSLFEGGRDGAKIPYIPDYQIHAQFGIESRKWGAFINMSYLPSTFTSASNTSALRADGTPDARVGKTDSYFLTDLSLRYQLKEKTTIFGGIRNVLDREYIASRHPHGARPGLPRFFNVGVEIYF